MILIDYVGHIGRMSLTDGHLGRHLEYFKTPNDARVASVRFIKYNASTTRINKVKNFKIKFQVILVFYWITCTFVQRHFERHTLHYSKDQVFTFIMMLICSRCAVSINNYSMLYMVHSIPLAFFHI